ncbi:hypothetical protein [Blastochloris sulfoviridis]|uniref:GGDEF domain-containing protein n=1 Tax=Blastochloris sulfoviridis TaxID=50712 RepID=A0A5M6HWU5_9HYPH|nr:hypothetical protein [Blastochloris sulfoviridis]KAA5600383.1 hypothetical protein F1193_10815 [Blastochloris sulfoviridis]
MRLDGPVLIVTRDVAAPIVDELCAAIDSGAVPAVPVEAPAVLRSTAPAAVVVLDAAGCDEAADELTAAVLTAEHFVPLIRRWSVDDAERIATLWLAADAGVQPILTALARANRVRTLLLETQRRRRIARAAALKTPALPDPWSAVRDIAVLVIDNGTILPLVAPICAARGLSMVGAPATTLAGTYLELRHFDALVIGPSIDTLSADSFLAWLRDDPRWSDLPAFRLVEDPESEPAFASPTEVLGVHDPRFATAFPAAACLNAFAALLPSVIQDMHGAGLADPDSGLLWPEAFRAGLIQAMAWSDANDRDFTALRIATDTGGPLPHGVPRMVACLLRRSDLVTRIDDGLMLAVLVGTEPDAAQRVATRISRVLSHTVLAETGQIAPRVEVACLTAEPDEAPQAFLARLTNPDEDESLAAAG